LEEFEPETRYTVQYSDYNYEFSPSFFERFLVNSEKIHTTVKEKVKKKEDKLVVFMPWGRKFVKFSYVQDKTLIALLAERLSNTTRDIQSRIYSGSWLETLLGV
jgi:hypothetical protein